MTSLAEFVEQYLASRCAPVKPVTLADLAVQAVMADTIDELAQVVQAAVKRFGEDALDLSCPVPASTLVLPLGTLIARRAGELTA